jgi:hypothetical protein
MPVHRLVHMVTALDERPGLDQTDAILAELQQMPRDHFVAEMIDELLDYRALLVEFDKLDQPGGSLAHDSLGS